jgi:predicted porin
MNKKLIATAMGLVMAGGMSLASADVKLYGQLDLSLDYADWDFGDDDWQMGSNTSAIGVKGEEDLGNGLSAFFKAEFQVDMDDADRGRSGTNAANLMARENDSAGFTGRDQYIGLGSGFGKVSFGTISTAYKSPGGKIDPFYRTRVESRAIGLQSRLHAGKGDEGQGRATNTVRYDTPDWSGFSGIATYTFDNDKTDANDDDPFSVGAQYKGEHFLVFGSYISTQAGGDDDAYQIGGQFNIGDFEVHGIFEGDGGLITSNVASSQANALLSQLSDAQCAALDPAFANCDDVQDAVDDAAVNGDVGDGQDIWSIGGSWTFGNNLIGADYGHGEDHDTPIGDFGEYDVWRVAAMHSFSKRTKIYAGYADRSDDDIGDVKLFTAGMRHNF